MALDGNKLGGYLATLTPTSSALQASQRLADAYGRYMGDAVAGVPIIKASIDSLAIPAMSAAMVFPTAGSPGSAAIVVQGGLIAFWGAMVAAPAAFFAGATVITPPPFAAVVASLTAVFVTNTATGASLVDAANAIASPIHTDSSGTGSATFPGPAVIVIA